MDTNIIHTLFMVLIEQIFAITLRLLVSLIFQFLENILHLLGKGGVVAVIGVTTSAGRISALGDRVGGVVCIRIRAGRLCGRQQVLACSMVTVDSTAYVNTPC